MSRPTRAGTVSLTVIGVVLSVIVLDVADNIGASGWLKAASVAFVFVVLAAFGAVTCGRDAVAAMAMVAPVVLVSCLAVQLFL